MKETLIAILPGFTIYTFTFIQTRFILTLLLKMSHAHSQFFKDEAGGRRLARDAGYHLTISAGDEPRIHARLVRSVTLVAWFRHLLIGTALVFVPVTITTIVRPQLVVEQYRNLVFVASGVHVLSAAISYGFVHKNEQLVATASDRREY